MRVLVGAVLALGLVWCGWWFVAARAAERAVVQWLAASGPGSAVEAAAGDIAVRGFPNRIDITLTAPALRAPLAGIAWDAPFVQIFALSYRPWHVIAALPPEQHLRLPEATVTLRAGSLQASLVVEPGTALTLDRLALAGDALTVAHEAGDAVSVATLRAGLRQAVGRRFGQDLAVEARQVVPGAAVQAALPPGAALPEALSVIRLAAEIDLTAPLDRHAGTTRPAVTAIALREARLVWGDLVIDAQGRVTADAQGRAEGRIVLRFERWRLAVAAAAATGMIAPEVAPTWTSMMELLASQGTDPDRLELPLSFQNGRMSLGPIPLGPAPLLALPGPVSG
jgi:hypothetical protein